MSGKYQIYLDMKDTLREAEATFYKRHLDFNEAETLKGACNHGTLLKIKEYQPKGGIPDTYMHGTKSQNKVWHRDSIIEWLGIHDGNRAEYLRKYGIYVSKILEQKWKGAA